MNESSHLFRLEMFHPDKQGWGAKAGQVTRGKLAAYIGARPGVSVFKLSVAGMKRIDVAFAAEAIVALVAAHSRRQPVCVVDLTDQDLRANLEAAARQLKVAIMAWRRHEGEALGLRPGSSAHQALVFALSKAGEVRATQFARAAGVPINNASWRFNRLWTSGLLLRTPSTASSGGLEHVYRVVGS